jgi:hypothetical protein
MITLIAESAYKNAFVHRRKHSLSLFDIALFGYLCFLSRTRVFIKKTTAQLAEDISEPYSKVAKSIQMLHRLDLLRRVTCDNDKGIMISPDLINNGSDKTKAFKFKIWSESKKFIQE